MAHQPTNLCDTSCRYFSGSSICNKLVVHPSYQGRGHGTAMLKWGVRLFAQDNVDTGVIAAQMGRAFVRAG